MTHGNFKILTVIQQNRTRKTRRTTEQVIP